MNLGLIDKNLEEFYKETNLAYWEHIVQNIPFNIKHQKKALDFFSDEEINHFIETSFNRAKTRSEKRKYSLLRSYFKLQRIELDNELLDLITQAINLIKEYKYSLNGEIFTEREIRERIAEAKDSNECRKYSNLWRQIHEECKQLVLQIIRLRNKLAQEEGYSSFPYLYFHHYEINLSTIFSLINSLKRNLINIGKRKRYSVEWRYNQEQLVRDILPKENALLYLDNLLLKKWGINLGSLNNISIVNDSSYTSNFPSNLCVPITIPTDVRIFIFSTKPSMDFYYTLFHEIGHALHYTFINQKDFIFKINPPWYEEAMASLVDKFLSIDECIEIFTKDTKKIKLIKMLNQSEDYRSYLNRIIEFIFEFKVYTLNLSIPEIDHLYTSLYKEYLGIENMEPDWGYFLLQISQWPFYEISYVIANAIVNQIIFYIYTKFKQYLIPEVFSFIRENFYAPGNTSSWKEKIEKTISQPFSFAFFWGDKK